MCKAPQQMDPVPLRIRFLYTRDPSNSHVSLLQTFQNCERQWGQAEVPVCWQSTVTTMSRMIPRPGATQCSCPGVGAKASSARSCVYHRSHIPTIQEVLGESVRSRGHRFCPVETCKTGQTGCWATVPVWAGQAGGAASTSPGLTQSQPHSKNGCALVCLCQEALKDTLPCADRTNIPSSFPEYHPGEAPTSIAQLDCTRLCKTLDSPTGTSNSLTEETAGEAYETNPVAAGLGRGLPSLHSFH